MPSINSAAQNGNGVSGPPVMLEEEMPRNALSASVSALKACEKAIGDDKHANPMPTADVLLVRPYWTKRAEIRLEQQARRTDGRNRISMVRLLIWPAD